MNLKIAAWASIIAAIFYVPAFIVSFMMEFIPENQLLYIFTFIILGISLLTALPLYLGYLKIAKLKKILFLRIMMHINIVSVILLNLFFASTIQNYSQIILILTLIVTALTGALILVTGIALLSLRSIFSGLITAISVLYIINGIFAMSLFMIILLPFTATATSILEAIFFFRASKKYD
ncbi:MAG: hypothetical protein ACMXYA_01090 [Candidatus Woesearchaeota archaeon]